MSNVIFRSKSEPSVEKPLPEGKEPTSTGSRVNDIEAPYRDYQKTHGKPLIADLYELGSFWNNRDGGFSDEISTIESYIQSQISEGEIGNTVSSVKNLIKKMEKINNLSPDSRPVIKLGVLANYAEFLNKNKQLKSNLRKYS